MSPPGIAPTTAAVPASESERCEGVPDLSTMEARRNFLVDILGVTPVQAHHKIRDYERDQRHRDARAFVREEFGPWLRSNYHRAVKGWAVAGKVGDRA